MIARLDYNCRIQAVLIIALVGSMTPAAWCQQGAIEGQRTEQQSVVVFAAREIPKGSVLKSEDLEESVINSRGFDKDDIPCRSTILGASPKYVISEGQVIFKHDLIPGRINRGSKSAQKTTVRATKFIQAKNTIRAGAVIKRGDLIAGSINTCDGSRWLHHIDSILGLQAKTTIVAGQVLRESALVPANPRLKVKMGTVGKHEHEGH